MSIITVRHAKCSVQYLEQGNGVILTFVYQTPCAVGDNNGSDSSKIYVLQNLLVGILLLYTPNTHTQGSSLR